MTNIEKICICAQNNNLYELFKDNEFFSNCNTTIQKTICQGNDSERSLCFSQTNNIQEQIDTLISAFQIKNKDTFKDKFMEVIGGNGNEGRKIMILHSSSLLSLLCFYNVTENHPLTLSLPDVNKGENITFIKSLFEQKNNLTYSYKGNNSVIANSNPSNMDVVLKSNNHTLFLESKFSEYLKNGLVNEIKGYVYKQIYDDLADFFKENKLKCEHDKMKGTFILRGESGSTKNYLQGIKQMISHFLAVCNYAQNHNTETVILGSILYKFEPELDDRDHFNNYVGLYGKLIQSLQKLLAESSISNLTLLPIPLTYQEVFSYDNHSFLDESVATFYKLTRK